MVKDSKPIVYIHTVRAPNSKWSLNLRFRKWSTDKQKCIKGKGKITVNADIFPLFPSTRMPPIKRVMLITWFGFLIAQETEISIPNYLYPIPLGALSSRLNQTLLTLSGNPEIGASL